MGWEHVVIMAMIVGAINSVIPVILALIEKDKQ